MSPNITSNETALLKTAMALLRKQRLAAHSFVPRRPAEHLGPAGNLRRARQDQVGRLVPGLLSIFTCYAVSLNNGTQPRRCISVGERHELSC
jgi:hypothetical protein